MSYNNHTMIKLQYMPIAAIKSRGH